MVDVTLDTQADGRVLVKLQTDGWEVNVHASRAELRKLTGIHAAEWDERRSIRAGESAGSPAFWAIDGANATLMIGHDDETWDVSVTFPLAAVAEIIREKFLNL